METTKGCKVIDPTDAYPKDLRKKESKQVRSKIEQEEKEKRRKEETEAHLYTVVKVACDKDLADQIGKDIYFDLVDHDKVHSFRVQKQQPFTSFKRRDVYGAWEQYLGLEHSDNTSKRIHQSSQNRHSFEKSVKIYN